MKEFNASMMREKVVFRGASSESTAEEREAAQVGSNRILIPLGTGRSAENVVVRAQNMHTALRFAASIVSLYCSDDNISMGMQTEEEWKSLWSKALSPYERKYNPKIWASVYIGGKPVFSSRAPLPFIDVIEKCALVAGENYDAAIGIAEAALKKSGHEVKIEQALNAAANFHDNGQSMRCGILHRSIKTGIFTFTADGRETEIRVYRTLGIAADFLEIINMQFIYRPLGSKIRSEEIPPNAPEAEMARAIAERHSGLLHHITGFEQDFTVKYRPDKPELRL